MQVVTFLLALALAFMAESTTEYVFASWIDLLQAAHPDLAKVQPLKYIALAVGLALAFAYSLDLLREAFGVVASPAWTGIMLTGLAVGRGANYLHDFAVKYLGLQAPGQ